MCYGDRLSKRLTYGVFIIRIADPISVQWLKLYVWIETIAVKSIFNYPHSFIAPNDFLLITTYGINIFGS